MATVLSPLTFEPQTFPDCCASISWPMIQALTIRLPASPKLVLSVGCGTGLLEAMLLQATEGRLDVRGVEVLSCRNKYLPSENFLQVATTRSIHCDAVMATTLIFVYPRELNLISRYLEACIGGAVEQVIWLSHRSDWPDAHNLLQTYFSDLEYLEGPEVAGYELLVVASVPRSIASKKVFPSDQVMLQ
nr:hypothetical protein CFP56_11480 [Quercus suber]